MEQQAANNNTTDDADTAIVEKQPGKRSKVLSYTLSVVGIIATILMVLVIVYYSDELNELRHFGYLGAFLISILGGCTIIIPVPMLAVVFALGGAMDEAWQVALVGISAAVGELIGAYIIYLTGHGAGKVLVSTRKGKIQRTYEKLLGLMERKGPITLFILSSVINPFFYFAALAAGALRFDVKKYTLIIFAGKIIKCMTVVFAGYWGFKGLFNALGIDL
jgi:membrane protein DedA with SNARE-associated domain